MHRLSFYLSPISLFALACTNDPLVSRTDLSLALAGGAQRVNGVSIEPGTGRRFVLDAKRGIFLERDGAFELHAAIEALTAEGHEPLSDFTDLAAVGQDQFALIAKNDGFLFDRPTGTFRRHFCYVPGEIIEIEPNPSPIEPSPDPIDPGEEYFQIAQNLAYDARSARIVAQPQTFAEDDGALLSAHVGTFARSDGTEQAWFELPDSTIDAGGLAIDAQGRALLGWGTSLWRFSFEDGRIERLEGLEALVRRVDGLALDPDSGHALVVDDVAKELIEIDLEAL